MSITIDVSDQLLDIDSIWNNYQETLSSLRLMETLVLAVFQGDVKMDGLPDLGIGIDLYESSEEVIVRLRSATQELANLVKFNLLSSAEGHIRYDFAVRINNNRADFLSQRFAILYTSARNRAGKVRFQGDHGILKAWTEHLSNKGGEGVLIDNFENILELRHWLAHGRWWNLDPALHLSVDDVKDIVENALDAMNLP